MVAVRLVRRALLASSLAGTVLLAACGSRGPLDVTIVEVVASLDATADGPLDGASPEAAADAAGDGPLAADGARDSGVDGAGDGGSDAADASDGASATDGNPAINCAMCVGQACGQQLFACVTSTTCRAALQCAGTTCFTGGTPNPQCILGCTMGDPTTEQQLLAVFECVLTSCGASCTGLLGGGLGGM